MCLTGICVHVFHVRRDGAVRDGSAGRDAVEHGSAGHGGCEEHGSGMGDRNCSSTVWICSRY